MVRSGAGLGFYLPIEFCMSGEYFGFCQQVYMVECVNVHTVWKNSLELTEMFLFL